MQENAGLIHTPHNISEFYINTEVVGDFILLGYALKIHS